MLINCHFLLLFINNQFFISSSHDLGEILVCMNCYKRNTVQAQDLVHSNNTSIIKPGKPKINESVCNKTFD